MPSKPKLKTARKASSSAGGSSGMMRAAFVAFVVAVILGVVLGVGGRAQVPAEGAGSAAAAKSAKHTATAMPQVPPPRVRVEVLTAPPSNCSAVVATGDTLSMYYQGALENGTVFIASPKSDGHHTARPMTFTMGEKQVLAGWEQGVLGMCVGERRRLTIPPALGFGMVATPISANFTIAPNSTLVFEVELVTIKGGVAPPGNKADGEAAGSSGEVAARGAVASDGLRTIFDEMDKDKNGKLSMAELAAQMRSIKVATKDGMKSYTEEEITQLLEKHHGPGSPNPDTDGDGEYSWEEWDPSKK